MMGDRDKRDEQSRYQRERIATAAMAALITRASGGMQEQVAEAAVKYADALIKELHKDARNG